jgi:F0F1-type ATP synthase delta subunit
MKKDKLERSGSKLPYVIGGAAALGTYKYLRLPKITNAIQRAGSKNLTVGLSYGASKFRKALGKIMYSPDINFQNLSSSEPRIFKGLVFFKATTPKSRASAKVVVNSPEVTEKISLLVSEKSKLDKLPHIGKYFAKTTPLTEALKTINVDLKSFKSMSPSEVKNVFSKLEKIHGELFIKPEIGQSLGKGTEKIYAPLSKATTHRQVKPSGVEKFFREYKFEPNPEGPRHIQKFPEKYILQENLRPKREIRIHTLSGKIIDQVRRFGGLEGTKTGVKGLTPKEKNEIEAALKKFYKARGVDYKKQPVSLAFDVVRSPKSGKIRFIEANPNSGFIFNLTDLTKPKYVSRPWEF